MGPLSPHGDSRSAPTFPTRDPHPPWPFTNGQGELADEPRLRMLVAEALGVNPEQLTAEVSLTDDLAADSLDLLELALLVEAEFGVSLPRRRLERMRSYGDLIEAVAAALGGRRRPPLPRPKPAFVRTRVVPAAASRGAFERAGELTPYAVENIAEDVVRAGRGARLEVTVPASTDDAGAAAILEQLSWLAERDVKVSLRRDPRWVPATRASVRAA